MRRRVLVALASLTLAGCSSTAPSPIQKQPPSVAGAWVGDVDGFTIRLDLTESPGFLFMSSSLAPGYDVVGGSGTLTPSAGRVLGFKVDGDNSLNFDGSHTATFQFGGYARFKGAIRGGALVGDLQDFGNSLWPFGPPFVAAIFNRQ